MRLFPVVGAVFSRYLSFLTRRRYGGMEWRSAPIFLWRKCRGLRRICDWRGGGNL